MNPQLQQAIERYRTAILQTDWVAQETYKFEFAAWVQEKVNWDAQTDDEVLQLLMQSQQIRYTGAGSIRGINFLTAPGRYNDGVLLSLADINSFRRCREKDPATIDWQGKLPPYPALSAWVAALFPNKWFPTGKTGFADTTSYLFPEATNLRKTGLKYITSIQPWFQQTQDLLQENGIGEVYLPKLAETFSTSDDLDLSKKTALSTADWTWIIQDFHYFVEREILAALPESASETRVTENVLDPVPALHQEVLDVLLTAREDHPAFYFGLRKNEQQPPAY